MGMDLGILIRGQKEAYNYNERMNKDIRPISEEEKIEQKIITGVHRLDEREKELLMLTILREQRRMYALLSQIGNPEMREAYETFESVKERQKQAMFEATVREKDEWKKRACKMEEELEEMRNRFEDIYSNYNGYKSEVTKEISAQYEQIGHLRDERKVLCTEIENLQREINDKVMKLDDVMTEMNHMKEVYEENQVQLDGANASLAESRKMIDKLHKEKRELTDEIKGLNERLNKARKADADKN